MPQRPVLTVAPFDWADRVALGFDLGAVQEALLAPNGYSVTQYFRDCTFGMIDLPTGTMPRPKARLSVPQALYQDASGDWQSAATRGQVLAAAEAHFEEDGVVPASPWVAFMTIPPAPSGATGFPDAPLGPYQRCVLDWSAPQNYMAHEIGHTLGWGHSWGWEDGDYGNPYCIMSAETYGNSNPTHRRTPPSGSRIPTIYGRNFWEGFGPMPAAATLFHALPEFASSRMVIRIERDQRVTLRALSEARPGDPVLAVMDLWGHLWMAELRVPTNWDAGLDGRPGSPCPAVIMHSSKLVPSHAATYMGRIDLRDKHATSYHPPFSADMKLILDYYDPVSQTAEVRFSEDPPPYEVGGPAPEFTPIDIDPGCAPAAGQYEIQFSEAYDRARSAAIARAQVEIIVREASGRVRKARSKVLTPDDSTGGIIAAATECEHGQVVGNWVFTAGEILGSYLIRVDGASPDGLVGSLSRGSGWVVSLPDGASIELRSWGIPSIH